jgi:hypothetical protein
MSSVRVVLVLVAIGVAALVAFLAFRGEPAKTPDASPPPAKGTAAPWNPFQTPAPTAGENGADEKKPAEVPPEPAPETTPGGTPVTSGAAVDVVVPYREGTKSRYRVREAVLLVDRVSGNRQFVIWTSTVATTVVRGDGTGAARVRVAPESFRFGTDLPARIEFDSEHPDQDVLGNPMFARALRPALATVGMPFEFEIQATGAARSVDGVSQVARRYEEELDKIGARVAREAADVPTTESLLERWSEILFPPVGGGTMSSADERSIAFLHTQNERWRESAHGKLRVVRNDPDAFAVEFVGRQDEVEELNQPARDPANALIVKARVVASDASFRAWWRFDRKAGRLLQSWLHDKHRYDVSRRVGTDVPTPPGVAPGFQPQYIDVEREISVELLEK